MRRNRGITSTIAGAISAHRYARNKRSRPGKRSRANAYAAVALVSTCPATTASEKIRLFNRKRPNGSATRALVKLSGTGWRSESGSLMSALTTI